MFDSAEKAIAKALGPSEGCVSPERFKEIQEGKTVRLYLSPKSSFKEKVLIVMADSGVHEETGKKTELCFDAHTFDTARGQSFKVWRSEVITFEILEKR